MLAFGQAFSALAAELHVGLGYNRFIRRRHVDSCKQHEHHHADGRRLNPVTERQLPSM
jgi:hypothetical protein